MNKQQRTILANVTRRGYRDGWPPEKFTKRQAAKLVEEVCELFLSFDWNGSVQVDRLRELVLNTKEQARRVFDNRTCWPDTAISSRELTGARAELADVVVVAACVAGALEELTGEPVDLLWLAVEKSAADVGRGVAV